MKFKPATERRVDDNQGRLKALFTLICVAIFAGCGGGGVTTTPVARFDSFSAPPVNGLNVTFNVAPGSQNGTSATVTSAIAAPTGIPAPSSIERKAQALSGATAFLFVSVTLNEMLPAALLTSEVLTLTNALSATAFYFVEIDDASAMPTKLATIAGSNESGIVTFANSPGGIQTFAAGHTYVFQFYEIVGATAPTSTPTASPAAVAPSPTPSVTGPSPAPSPLPTPAPSPAPGSIVLSASSLSFTSVGTPMSLTVAQANSSGAFTVTTPTSGTTNSCAGIATATVSGAAISVMPTINGHCVFNIGGAAGQSATLTIDVTTTTVGGI